MTGSIGIDAVDMIHGCVPDWRPGVQGLRNYVGDAALIAYLRDRRAPTGRADVPYTAATLSVDDATVGAARACLLAREHGWEVILFLNPAHIARKRTYWFSTVDAMLDAVRQRHVRFAGTEYCLDDHGAPRALRLAIKRRLMPLAEHDTDAALDDVARSLGLGSVEVAEHARTIGVADVRRLIVAGVRIGNHGWDHRDIAAMRAGDIADDIRRAADWFATELDAAPTDYAVPYGLARVPDGASDVMPGMIFLADAQLPPGDAGGRHWNRRDISADIRRHAA